MATRRKTAQQKERLDRPVRSAAAFAPRIRSVALPYSKDEDGEPLVVEYILPNTRSLLSTGELKVPMPLTSIALSDANTSDNGKDDNRKRVERALQAVAREMQMEDDLVSAALVWPIVVPDTQEPDREAGECHISDLPSADRTFLAGLLMEEGAGLSPFRAG